MRSILAAIFICAIGLPAASALPMASAGSVSLTGADTIVQAAKRAPAQKQTRAAKKSGKTAGKDNGLGGIHPMVGSGDY